MMNISGIINIFVKEISAHLCGDGIYHFQQEVSFPGTSTESMYKLLIVLCTKHFSF